MNEKDLKIQALTERIAELTAQYEDKIADLRVALTVQAQQLEDAKKEDANVEVATGPEVTVVPASERQD